MTQAHDIHAPAGLGLLFGFFASFWILHAASPHIFSFVFGWNHYEAYVALPSWKHRLYWRRLVRAQFYYMYVGIAGCVLLLTQFKKVNDMIEQYNWLLEVHMCLALAHWLTVFVEDVLTWDLLCADIDNPLFRCFLAGMYGAHHCVTVFAYVFIVSTGNLASLGCFGLVFEIPVAVQSLREFAVTFGVSYAVGRKDDDRLPALIACWPPKSPTKIKWEHEVQCFWAAMGVTLVCFRFGPCCVYLWSIIFHMEDLKVLDALSLVVYCSLGGVFCLANPLYASIQSMYFLKDKRMARAARASKRNSLSSSIAEDGGGAAASDPAAVRRAMEALGETAGLAVATRLRVHTSGSTISTDTITTPASFLREELRDHAEATHAVLGRMLSYQPGGGARTNARPHSPGTHTQGGAHNI